MVIARIVSGGQTGVDRGALAAALELGFPYGGMIPKGRKAKDGIVPLEFTAMTESDSEDYRFRTRWNAEHSDATLILSFTPMLEGGTLRTRQYCMNSRKPYFVDHPSSPAIAKGALKVSGWLDKVRYARRTAERRLSSMSPVRENQKVQASRRQQRRISRG